MVTMTVETFQMKTTVKAILGPPAEKEWSRSPSWHGQQAMGLYSARMFLDEDE